AEQDFTGLFVFPAGYQNGSREAAGSGVLLKFGAQRGQGLRLAHAGHREFGGTRNRGKAEPRNPVWFVGLRDQDKPSKLVRIALLHQTRDGRGRSPVEVSTYG